MRPNRFRRTGRIAVWGLMLALGAARAQGKTVVLAMPACPLSMTTIPETITEFTLPTANPLGTDLSVSGTLETTDQTSATLTLTQVDFEAGLSGLQFSRTVKQVGHLTGRVAFDKGCTKTDPYGSNDCTWAWGETIATSYMGALQENVQAGRLIVDLQVDATVPFQFSCPVCGANCTVNVPEQLDNNEIWTLMFSLFPFPSFLHFVPALPAPPAMSESFTPSTIATDGASLLSFTLTNPNADRSLTGVGFTDNLPAGVVVNSRSGLSSSCGGEAVVAAAGTSSVSLAGATLDPGGSCSVTFSVTSATVGSYVNTTGAVTANESLSGSAATGSLAVTPLTIPTLSPWGLFALGLAILGCGLLKLKQRAAAV
jgi:hypothetical protein